MNQVRLPGAAAFVPPPAPAVRVPTALDTREDREQFFQVQTFISRGVGAPLPAGQLSVPQQAVWASVGMWRGCDVYIQPVPPPAGFSSVGTLSVYIWAVVEGMRCLVASGRYRCDAGAAPILPAKWIAGVRGIATKFEVTVGWTQANGAAFVAGQYAIGIVASNEATELPDDLGAELAGRVYLQAGVTATGIGVNIAGVQIAEQLELVNVRAANLVAAPRFLQLFDTALAIPANGTVPLMCWPMGAVIGEGLGTTRVRYRAKNRIQLVTSSTGLTLTVQADCAISAEVR